MRTIGKILAILCSVTYLFGLTLLMTLLCPLNLFSVNYYTNIARSVDLKTIKVSDFGSLFDGIDVEYEATVEDALIESIKDSGVDEQVAVAIVNNKKTREVVGKFIGDYVNYSVGGNKPYIAREDVVAVFNEVNVKELVDPKKQEEDIDKIYNQLNDLIEKIPENKGENYDVAK